jgi:Family of unknown function (DUF6086)
MSCRFYLTSAEPDIGPDLWRPIEDLALLFKGHSQTVAVATGAPSGVGEYANGGCAVDLPTFERFCREAIAYYHRTDEGLFRSMTVGFIATALALLDRAGRPMPDKLTAEQQAAWTALRDQHASMMHR